MDEGTWRTLVELLAQVPAAWPNRDFTWDDRFACATGVLEGADETATRAAVSSLFGQTYTSATIAAAPPTVKALASATGLRADQLVFASQPVGSLVAFGLWWPWGGGSRVSGRFGVTGPGAPAELAAAIRQAFSIR